MKLEYKLVDASRVYLGIQKIKIGPASYQECGCHLKVKLKLMVILY